MDWKQKKSKTRGIRILLSNEVPNDRLGLLRLCSSGLDGLGLAGCLH